MCDRNQTIYAACFEAMLRKAGAETLSNKEMRSMLAKQDHHCFAPEQMVVDKTHKQGLQLAQRGLQATK